MQSDPSRANWQIEGPFYLGGVVHHLVLDPRDGKTMVMAARTGHLGPTIYCSTDFGATWEEASRPPKFTKAPEGEQGRRINHVFWLTPGYPSEPCVWYAGTSPIGLFRSEDGGVTWDGVSGFNENPNRSWWAWNDQDGPPGNPGCVVHSILIDPREPNHMFVSLSGGGVLESTNQGGDWAPLNQGLMADWPLEDPKWGYDPHCVRLHPLDPDRLYQQNHCGIYRMERSEGRWIRIGEAMPKDVGDIGFPLVVHPRNLDVVWVFPMDGTSVWPRVSPGGRPAVYTTRDAGATWQRQDRGLPREQAWFTVKRQAMSVDAHEPVGVYFGTSSGEVWASLDEGETWRAIALHLPEIYAVEAVELTP